MKKYKDFRQSGRFMLSKGVGKRSVGVPGTR